MGKFFKRGPKKCNVCGKEVTIFKTMKKGFTEFNYCKPCYDEYYKIIEIRVKKQVMDSVKAGKMISMKEALELTKTVTAEIEKENNEVKNNDKK